MDYQRAKTYLLNKPEAFEDYPFGDEVAVCKVRGKVFALFTQHQGVERVNLKCDPEHAQALRDLFPAIKPGYHMNKKHWNTVLADGSISNENILEWTLDSYNLVVNGLPKKQKQELKLL